MTNAEQIKRDKQTARLFTGAFTRDICEALGWQGGTIHQVIREIKRLKRVDETARAFGNAVAFAQQAGQIRKENTEIAETGSRLNNALNEKID
jgi:hypothetical protein